MLRAMKTTVQIADALLAQTKRLMHRENRTLRSLVEEGLRLVLAARRPQRRSRKLRWLTVKGKGLQPGLQSRDWQQIRDLIYRGRGS
jgi:hypothetical protein